MKQLEQHLLQSYERHFSMSVELLIKITIKSHKIIFNIGENIQLFDELEKNMKHFAMLKKTLHF